MLGRYDALEGSFVPLAPDEAEAYSQASKSSDAMVLALQQAMGTNWPCGHVRNESNTHTIGGISQCKVCRRARWNRAVKLAAHNARIEQWERLKELEARAELERIQRQGKEARRLHAKQAVEAREKQRREMVDKVVAGAEGRRKSLDEIKTIVAGVFGMSVGTMLSKSRTQNTVRARCVVAMVLLERGLSYPRTAKLLGRGDHSTMINARKMFPIYARRDSRVMEAYELVRDRD